MIADAKWSDTQTSWNKFKAGSMNLSKLGKPNTDAVMVMDKQVGSKLKNSLKVGGCPFFSHQLPSAGFSYSNSLAKYSSKSINAFHQNDSSLRYAINLAQRK